jgi:release factor glutamine methyltransferase
MQASNQSIVPGDPLETIHAALQAGTASLMRAGIESARLDAEVLLALALQARREDLYVHSRRPLTKDEVIRYQDNLARRTDGEPVAYISGRREFWSLDFAVSAAVLVPRPETELLVELALEFLEPVKPTKDVPVRVLELGVGSGAVAISLACARRDIEVWASDLSVEALRIAQLNAARHAVEPRCRFFHGDLFSPFRERHDCFQVIVSNPPYIPHGEIAQLPVEVRDWEPIMALDGGTDGLDFYRVIVERAPLYLTDGGILLVEIGPSLETQVRQLFTDSRRYRDSVVHADYSRRPRVVSACLLSTLSG